MNRTQVFEWECSVQDRPKLAREVKSKVMSMLIIFVDIKRIVHTEFFLARQTVNSASYSLFYGDCVKMWEDFLPELWRQKNWLLHHDNAQSHTLFLTTEFFYQKKDCRPPPNRLFSASPIENETERPPF
jgi:hypothetical protein